VQAEIAKAREVIEKVRVQQVIAKGNAHNQMFIPIIPQHFLQSFPLSIQVIKRDVAGPFNTVIGRW
jgi:hypothetical protein